MSKNKKKRQQERSKARKELMANQSKGWFMENTYGATLDLCAYRNSVSLSGFRKMLDKLNVLIPDNKAIANMCDILNDTSEKERKCFCAFLGIHYEAACNGRLIFVWMCTRNSRLQKKVRVAY